MIKYSNLVPYQWLFSDEKNDLQINLYLSEMEVELDETSREFLQNNYIFPEVLYGDGQRSTEINNNLFFDDPEKYINSINKILDGEEPNNIDYFKGTFFEHFKGGIRVTDLVKSCIFVKQEDRDGGICRFFFDHVTDCTGHKFRYAIYTSKLCDELGTSLSSPISKMVS